MWVGLESSFFLHVSKSFEKKWEISTCREQIDILDYLGQPQNTVTVLMTIAGLQEEKSKMKWYPRVMNSLLHPITSQGPWADLFPVSQQKTDKTEALTHTAYSHIPNVCFSFPSLTPTPEFFMQDIFFLSKKFGGKWWKTTELKITILSQTRDHMNTTVFSISLESFCIYSFICNYVSPLIPTDHTWFTGHLRLLISLILQFRCLR